MKPASEAGQNVWAGGSQLLPGVEMAQHAERLASYPHSIVWMVWL